MDEISKPTVYPLNPIFQLMQELKPEFPFLLILPLPSLSSLPPPSFFMWMVQNLKPNGAFDSHSGGLSFWVSEAQD